MEDYGDSVEDLSQFYDLFPGDKQYDPEKRGRFGRGVKEFIGASDERVITSTGVHPAGVAAACLYKAGQERGRWVTQSDVAESGNVTPSTVRTHYETLEERVA